MAFKAVPSVWRWPRDLTRPWLLLEGQDGASSSGRRQSKVGILEGSPMLSPRLQPNAKLAFKAVPSVQRRPRDLTDQCLFLGCQYGASSSGKRQSNAGILEAVQRNPLEYSPIQSFTSKAVHSVQRWPRDLTQIWLFLRERCHFFRLLSACPMCARTWNRFRANQST